MAKATTEAWMGEVETYVSHHQNMVTQYIVTCLIMGLCLDAEQLYG